MTSPALDAGMAFLIEACRLKSVIRGNDLIDLSRPENVAEHSWHVALCALVLTPPEAVAPVTPQIRDRAIAMLLVHDLVEIDAGDHPIHLPHDPDMRRAAEAAGAARLFALLPADQGAALQALWKEFSAGQSPAARLAQAVDHLQPILQVLCAQDPRADHLDIVADNLATGRARWIATHWPEMAACLQALRQRSALPCPRLSRQIAFLATADRLKSVTRATPICDGSRPENSAEHSWHLALFAQVLADHAPKGASPARVTRMLLLHDLVEIDAGDTPIYAAADRAAIARAEIAAADRIFGLLPNAQGRRMRALWDEFEAARTADARFAKALDRFQPPNLNLATDGVSWRAHGATLEQVSDRVGQPILRGAPSLWQWIAPRIEDWFARQG
jgi:putative hydrolase of HD superfamily